MRTTLARAANSAALLAAAIACSPSSARAYRTLADVEGSPTPIVWERAPTIALQSESFPDDLRALVAVELEPAAEVWTSVSCAAPLLSIDHAHVAPDIWVRYEDDWLGSGFDPAAAASTDLILQSSAEGGTSLVAATIHLNGRMEWVAYGEARRRDMRDVRVVLVHELGHALGLAHNCEPEVPELVCGTEHSGIVMHPIYGAGGTRLAADDVEGICALYPRRTTEPFDCEQAADCYDGELCVDGACHRDGLFGSACTQRSDCATTYCIEESSSPSGGICTRECESSSECPSGAQCVPVEGMTVYVCQPRGASGTCGVARGGAASGDALGLGLVLVVLAIAGRRRCRT